MSSVLGLDIGGANLKAAHTSGIARSCPFALWKGPAGLADALRAFLRAFPAADRWAVTMTGELCDCFATKRDGVHAILDAVRAVAGSTVVHVWQTNGCFADLETARKQPLLAAASNWLALATFAGRFARSGSALLLDIGTTTTDIIPLLDGRPVPCGRTDPDRLRTRELVYTGVRRTPVCALLGADGAAEFFATMHDVYLVLGEMPDDPTDCDTADGRPATRPLAHARLARMLCADTETSTEDERRQLAETLRTRQLQLLRQAIESVSRGLPAPPTVVIVSGSGEFLARSLVAELQGPRLRSLERLHGSAISEAACAHAVAVLVAEGQHGP